MRAEDVAATILEVAFTKTAPPPALNVVNPRGVAWMDVLASVREALVEERNLEVNDLPMIPFGDWFGLLEKRAESASSEDIAKVVRARVVSLTTMTHSGLPACYQTCGVFPRHGTRGHGSTHWEDRWCQRHPRRVRWDGSV